MITFDDMKKIAETSAEQVFVRMNTSFDLSQTEMPPRYYDASFTNMNTPEAQKVKEFCLSDNGVLVMEGTNGTGKTYLACSAINERIKHGKTGGFYVSCKYTVCPLVRSSRSYAAKETELDLIRRFSKIPFVVFDEVGKGDDKNIEKGFISSIISARYDFVKPTILISNMSMVELCDWLGQDISSRFHETATVVTLEGKDYRYGC